MISLIIPTYNEKENIKELVERIFKVSKRLNIEVIIVDDNSPDGTAEIIKFLSKKYKIKLLERPKKLGLTSAVLDGLKLSKGDIIGVMDADLSHSPEKIPEMINLLKNNDIVIASKFVKDGKVEGQSLLKYSMSRISIIIAKLFLDIRVKDPASGFFFCKRKIFENTKFKSTGFKILLSILVKNKNKKIKEIPYTFVERKRGKSKLNFREVINYLITVFRLKIGR
jgi:dolichol-phosphate mannosyltransferase